MAIIRTTGYLSLAVQVITGLLDAFVLTLPVGLPFQLLRQLIWMELIVQIIEGSFYVWMLNQFSVVKNVTPYRYWDWFITTPTMLTTLSVYFLYLKEQQQGPDHETKDLITYLKEYHVPLIAIFILDWLMLLFGYLGERNVMSVISSTVCGFVPFIAMFAVIYHNFAQVNDITLKMFYYFVAVWSLYGVAALLSYKWKNAFYNILDLFAKNFFGVFLAVMLYKAAAARA